MRRGGCRGARAIALGTSWWHALEKVSGSARRKLGRRVLVAHTIDDVALVDARIVPKRASAYGTVLYHVAVGSTAGGLPFGHAGWS